MTGFIRPLRLLAAISGFAARTGFVMAQISVVNTAAVVFPVADDPKTAVLSFNTGAAANKLIVQVSAEWEATSGSATNSAPGSATTPLGVSRSSRRCV